MSNVSFSCVTAKANGTSSTCSPAGRTPTYREGRRRGARRRPLLKRDGIRFDVAYTSELKRAQRTLELILEELGQVDLPSRATQELNERDYGDLSGLNKDEARKRGARTRSTIWRRSYDIAPPGGESLKDTAARVLPYYKAHIWPTVKAGSNVLVAAHGNSLRALIMRLEG